MKELRALVLEDNPHMQTILKTLLQGLGVREVIEARDAASAFGLVREYQPDLAIVDYVLGDLDGLEFVRLLRTSADSPNKYLPVIMCTAHGEPSTVRAAINAGANEFLVKPVSADGLMKRLNALINNPRPYIDSRSYFGPDRRRRRDPRYQGPWRRKDDAMLAD